MLAWPRNPIVSASDGQGRFARTAAAVNDWCRGHRRDQPDVKAIVDLQSMTDSDRDCRGHRRDQPDVKAIVDLQSMTDSDRDSERRRGVEHMFLAVAS